MPILPTKRLADKPVILEVTGQLKLTPKAKATKKAKRVAKKKA
jgi:hypothetical protein